VAFGCRGHRSWVTFKVIIRIISLRTLLLADSCTGFWSPLQFLVLRLGRPRGFGIAGGGTVFIPPPTDRCVGATMFSGCPSVRASVRASARPCCVCPGVRPARYLTKQLTEFQRTLADDVVEGTDEVIRFRGSRAQGQDNSEVRYLSELLLSAESHTSTLGHRSSI